MMVTAIPYNHITSIIYAQELDTNDSKVVISKILNPNVNTTETAVTNTNVTKTAATNTNATETTADKKIKYCYVSQFGSLGTKWPIYTTS